MVTGQSTNDLIEISIPPWLQLPCHVTHPHFPPPGERTHILNILRRIQVFRMHHFQKVYEYPRMNLQLLGLKDIIHILRKDRRRETERRRKAPNTSNSCLRSSSFLASDRELLCTSKIIAAPATYVQSTADIRVGKYILLMKQHDSKYMDL